MPRQDSLAERSHTSLSHGDHVTCDNGEFEELEHTTGGTEEPLSLKQKVASQLEHYLSEGHLAQDGFLLKHVQRNKLRYVSLKLLTSFSKIRELTRDWRVTASAAHASPLLQLNAEGTKVRRVEPPPAWLLAAPTSRLLLAWNLPSLQARGSRRNPQNPKSPGLLETVLRVFGIYGDVTSVRVLHPGKAVPLDLRPHARTHRELGRSLCAVVEFHSLEGSRRAHRALAAEGGGRPAAGGRGAFTWSLWGARGGQRWTRTRRERRTGFRRREALRLSL
ncbi:LOW QUALITY PROTEIN: la-related protein 6 [Gadus morhua]|uniref:LOW QUALITY PROTEIN: la-related protein 6 n=1 Tax=Gadus morhua TaxID=8049 RepID=UPI003F4A185B